nr:periplasmic heavy metal sensor [Halovulum dunhuangense]
MNLAVVGVVAGFLLRGPATGPAGWNGPGGVPHLLGALPQQERAALREDLRDGRAKFRAARTEIREARAALVEALLAEPYSEAALSAALDRQETVWREIGDRTRAVLLARIAAMTPEARRAMAETLESRSRGDWRDRGGRDRE